MGRKVRSGGSTAAFSFNKAKKYRYNSAGTLEEFTGEPGAEEITISGSKSSLRRMADMERNISILATKLTTSDGGTTDGDDASFGTVSNKSTRFKKGIRMDDTLDMRDTIDMNNKKITDLADPTAGGDACNKTYADARQAAAEATASADATSKANAAQAAAISAAASDATTKANAAEAAAIAAVTNGAGAAFDTLKEIQDAMATDAELSAAISGLTIGNGTVTISAGNGMSGGGSFSMNQTNSETISVAMSGSFTGDFTATGDVTAYSDESLKTNIQTIDNALERVEAVRGVTFDRLEDGSTSTGVVAQELQAVLPEAVKTDENGIHHVAYGNITGLLIEAVKELSAEVKELKK